MAKFLGLDLSTKTGAAIVDSTATVVYAAQITFPKLMGEARINAIAGRVMNLIDHHKPCCVIIEDYAVGRFAGAAIVSISIGSVVRFLLWQNDIPFLVVSPTALKKFLTGKGNAKKENMILDVYKKYGFTSPTNDEADAVALGMFGVCALKPSSTFTKAEVAVVADTLKTQSLFTAKVVV